MRVGRRSAEVGGARGTGRRSSAHGPGGAQKLGPWVSGGLEDRGYALAAADAHGFQQVAAVPSAQLAQAGGQHPGAGGADGVAERDTGSVDVELVRVVPPSR